MSATLLTADDPDRLPSLAHITTLRKLARPAARTVAIDHAWAFRKVIRRYRDADTLHVLRMGGGGR